MNLAAYLLLFVAVGVAFVLLNLVIGKIVRPSKPDAEKGTIYECGEPTIGSAWVQFDLRFYVVALLFVIFDVEVAFFFPWAEVFGKANAIAAWQSVPQGHALTEYGRQVRALVPDSSANARLRGRYEDLAALEPQPPEGLSAQQFEQFRDVRRLYEEKRVQFDAEMAHRRERVLDLANQGRREDAARIPVPQAPTIATMFPDLTPEQREQFEKKLTFDVELATEFDQNRQTAHDLAFLALWEIVVFFGFLLVGFAYLWSRGDLEWVRSIAERGGKWSAPPPPPSPSPRVATPTPTPVAAPVGSGH
jgi:NADH:ubiquinone oxidoreductase subunit 3 (subunit A)